MSIITVDNFQEKLMEKASYDQNLYDFIITTNELTQVYKDFCKKYYTNPIQKNNPLLLQEKCYLNVINGTTSAQDNDQLIFLWMLTKQWKLFEALEIFSTRICNYGLGRQHSEFAVNSLRSQYAQWMEKPEITTMYPYSKQQKLEFVKIVIPILNTIPILNDESKDLQSLMEELEENNDKLDEKVKQLAFECEGRFRIVEYVLDLEGEENFCKKCCRELITQTAQF